MAAKRDVTSMSISTIRILAADIVQKANSGHPGMPLGMSPAAHILFTKFLRVTAAESKWASRDRFVLSNGHGCALLYIMLHLMDFDVSMDDLKAFRQWGSRTPGHPEYGHTHGVEATTGPLGQGISTAVGLAMGQVHQAAVYNQPGFPIFDNYTYVFCGDGCLQEGISSEACSLAGHLKLGRLIVIYDDNKISIDGSTELSFTEDVPKRFEAYGWHTLTVEKGDTDLDAIEDSIKKAQAVTDRPSIISLKTTIGYTSKKAGDHSVHGAPLGKEAIAEMKDALGFDPKTSFFIPDDVKALYKAVIARNDSLYNDWVALVDNYKQKFPQLHEQLSRTQAGKFPAGWYCGLPQTASAPALATRKMSQTALNSLAKTLPELVGGSADLTPSTLTELTCSKSFQANAPQGRYFRFGVREHGMMAISNGLSIYGGLIPFSATFLNFVTYGFPAVRIAAISGIRQILVMTHDSIGLGEDGPTHQPVEVLALLRATPNVTVIRPADQHEVNGAYISAIENLTGPTVLALSRQAVPTLLGNTAPEKVELGAYTIHLPKVVQADVVLIATGTEVSMCMDAAEVLSKKNVAASVVSAPSLDLFDKQSVDYRRQVLPLNVPVVSVEAQGPGAWSNYSHLSVAVPEWGASAPAEVIYDKLGFTPDKIAATALKLVQDVKTGVVPALGALRCQY